MRRDEPLAIVTDKRQQVFALLCHQVDLAHAEKEDGIEVVEIAGEELLPGGDAGFPNPVPRSQTVDQKNDRTPAERSQPAEQPPSPRKRFRIEKVEERVAPKKQVNGSASGSFDLTSSSSTSY